MIYSRVFGSLCASTRFTTLAGIFNSMGPVVGRVIGTLFFLFLLFAALSTVIAVVENISAFFMDKWNWSRKKATGTTYMLLLVLNETGVVAL